VKTKQLMTWGAIAVGGYLAYRWYQKDKANRTGKRLLVTNPAGNLSGSRDQYSTPDAPAWYGYGRTQDDMSQGKAFGAETAETMPTPSAPDVVMGDVQEAPQGAAFMDDDEFTEDSSAF